MENYIIKEKVEAIKNGIKAFYTKHGIESKIIYRTCSDKFGDESPHNLAPLKNKRKEKHVNVYVDFRNEKIDKDNIKFIIAFPDKDSDLVPRLKKVRLPSEEEKIDPKRTKYPYKFYSLDELYKEYFVRFPI